MVATSLAFRIIWTQANRVRNDREQAVWNADSKQVAGILTSDDPCGKRVQKCVGRTQNQGKKLRIDRENSLVIRPIKVCLFIDECH
jgi:hypothetical protein